MQERMSEDMTKKAMLEALARRRAMRHEPNPAAEVGLGRANPAMQQPIPHSIGQSHVMIVFGGYGRKPGLQAVQIVAKRPGNGRRT